MGMADKIKIVLIKKKLTVKDLAEKLSCSSANISHKFKRDNFSEKELLEIANALDCEFDASFVIKSTGEKV
jgi:DNA-binding Xre family transcriptional regulator